MGGLAENPSTERGGVTLLSTAYFKFIVHQIYQIGGLARTHKKSNNYYSCTK